MERLERRIPNVTGDVSLGEFVLRDEQSVDSRDIRAFRASLAALEQLPTAELDRLVTETLDICSHRLDAWITSLASKRLGDMRQQQALGSHLGAFGWVEDLHPDANRSGVETPDDGGYIHAPSASHAAAAAILRNAYLTHKVQDSDRYAIVLLVDARACGARLLDRCGKASHSARCWATASSAGCTRDIARCVSRVHRSVPALVPARRRQEWRERRSDRVNRGA